MHFCYPKRLAAQMVLAVAMVSLGACSSAAAPLSLPNAMAPSQSSNTSPRHAQITGVVGEVSYQDTDNPTGPLIAGQSITMTLNLSASSYPVNFGGGFFFNLPSNTATRFLTVGGPNVLNNCPGLVVNPTPSGDGTLSFLAASSGAALTAPCQIKAFLVAQGAGKFSAGSVIWNGSGTFTLLSATGMDLSAITVNPPQDHLYVPVDSTPGQGSVKIYTEGASPTLACTLSNTRIPNPVAVAVNPGFGYIYVLDASGNVVAFRGINEGTQCNSTPLGGWAVSSDATYLTVDGNNNVIVSGCSGTSWYSEQGASITRINAPTGYCYSDVSANYWKNVMYLEQLHPDAITPFTTPMSGPVEQCQMSAYGITGYDPSAPSERPWHIAAGSSASDIVLTSTGGHLHGSIMLPQNTMQDVQLLGGCNWNPASGTFITGTTTSAVAYDTFTSEFTAPQGSYIEEYTWPIGPSETAIAFFDGGAHIAYGP